MESTYRIYNLLFANYINTNFRVEKYIIKEANFIKNNLELHSNNNHILFNYIGLVISDELYGGGGKYPRVFY
ncbi:hypothetical protein CWB57_16115 [Pseudoalteromonas sp. S186]|nr:hypothetical protein CWB57_16115 [Pseudoalteromonas sp. S186]